jgi:hypothetical protein
VRSGLEITEAPGNTNMAAYRYLTLLMTLHGILNCSLAVRNRILSLLVFRDVLC